MENTESSEEFIKIREELNMLQNQLKIVENEKLETLIEIDKCDTEIIVLQNKIYESENLQICKIKCDEISKRVAENKFKTIMAEIFLKYEKSMFDKTLKQADTNNAIKPPYAGTYKISEQMSSSINILQKEMEELQKRLKTT